jgi:hypothetical protein
MAEARAAKRRDRLSRYRPADRCPDRLVFHDEVHELRYREPAAGTAEADTSVTVLWDGL